MANPTSELLHIASFHGNIGDNASHNGFYGRLNAVNGWQLPVVQKEIRHTYLNYQGRGRWQWDGDLIRDMNSRLLNVIGGGNYFELWLENSSTGTTVDLDPKLLQHLTRPLFFHAVGCDPNIGVSENTVGRFRTFVEAILAHPLCLLTVRNDGSKGYLRQYLGDDLASRIPVIPDPGFFVDPGKATVPESLTGKRYWAINLATDRPERRFPGTDGRLDYDGFIRETASFIQQACESREGLEVVLVPHIYSDLDPIQDVIRQLPDAVRRWRLSVAPLLHGMGSEKSVFALYRDAELAIGPRFHANVCPIGLGTPTIGLVTTEKLTDLYDELDMPERTVNAQTPGFAARLMSLCEDTLASRPQIQAQYAATREQLVRKSDGIYRQLSDLVSATP